MDFSTIKSKINRFDYTTATDILEDLRLIFTNCEKYNENDTVEYAAGQRLCRLFVRKVKEYKLDTLLAAKAKQNGASPSSSKKQKVSQDKSGSSPAAKEAKKTESNPRHARRNSRRST